MSRVHRSTTRRGPVPAVGLIAALLAASLTGPPARAAQPVAPTLVLADVDGDVISDSLTVELGFDEAAPRVGSITAVSGATGQTLYAVLGEAGNDRFGYVVRLADLDGDGAAELITSAPNAASGSGAGRVYVFAAATGQSLRTIAAAGGFRIGTGLETLPDQDGDGWAELLVEGAVGDGAQWHARTFIYSGASGALLAARRATIGGIRRTVAAGGRAYLAGDLDDSGAVDVHDVTLIASGLAGGGDPALDVNRDGSVDAADLVAVIEAMVRGERSMAGAGVVTEFAGESAQMASRWTQAHDDAGLSLTWSQVTHNAAGDGSDGGESQSPELSDAGGSGPLFPGLVPCDCDGGVVGSALGRPACLSVMGGCPEETLPVGTVVPLSFPAGCTVTIDADGVQYEPVGENGIRILSAGCISVTMTCVGWDGVCCGCQTCRICAYEEIPPCEARVDFLNCPEQPVAIDALDDLVLHAAGFPREMRVDNVLTRGSYEWAIQAGDCEELCPDYVNCPDCPEGCPVSYYAPFPSLEGGLRLADHPAFATLNPVAGQCLWVRVRYRFDECNPHDCCQGPWDCCHAVATCKFPLYERDPTDDTDGDGYCDWEEVANQDRPLDRLIDADRDIISRLNDVRGVTEYVRAPQGQQPPWVPAPYRERFDTDGDGVQDLAELRLGLSPELRYTTPGAPDRYTTAGLAADVDQDLVFDVYEGALALDPTVRDTDGDGIVDGIELRTGTDPTVSLRHESADTDGDGLCDYEENAVYGTSSSATDTDGDGLSDFFEARAGLNPLTPHSEARIIRIHVGGSNYEYVYELGPSDGEADGDFDGLINSIEQYWGADPTLPDSDGDGVSDADEITQGSSPTDPADGGEAPAVGDVCWMLVSIGGRSFGQPPYDFECGHDDDDSFDPRRPGPGNGTGIGIGGVGDDKLTTDWTVDIGIDLNGDGDLDDPGERVVPPIETGPDGRRTTMILPFPRGHCYTINLGGRRLGVWEHDSWYLQITPVDMNNLVDGRPQLCNTCCCHTIDQDEEDGAIGTFCFQQAAGTVRRATICLPVVDLDIGLGDADEDVEGTNGWLIGVNDNDTDQDGIVDVADGFDLRGERPADDQTAGEQFAPIVLRVGGLPDPLAARIVFDYDASDPASCEVIALPDGGGSYVALPPEGSLRVWKADGGSSRQKAGLSADGHFVQPGVEYSLAQLGVNESSGEATFWVEAVRPSTGPGDLGVSASLVGGCPDDAVRLTAPKPELVTWDETSGQVSPVHPLGSIERPRPTVELSVTAPPHLDAQQNLIVPLHWRVRDELSDLAGPADRVQRLVFWAGSRQVTSIDDLAMQAEPAGVMPWQPHLCDLSGDITLTIPPPPDDESQGTWGPGAVVIRAVTSANAAQEIGWDQVAVQLTLVEDSLGVHGPHWLVVGDDAGVCELDCTRATTVGAYHLVGVEAEVSGSFERTITGGQPSVETFNLLDARPDEVACGTCNGDLATTAVQGATQPAGAPSRYAVALQTGADPAAFPLGTYGCEAAPAGPYTISNGPPASTTGPFIEVLHNHSATQAIVIRYMLATGETYWAAWTGAASDLGSFATVTASPAASGCPFPLTFRMRLHYTDDGGSGGTTVDSDATLTLYSASTLAPAGGVRYALVVDGSQDLPASPASGLTPIIMRIPALTDEAADQVSLTQNGEIQATEPFTFSPRKHYVVDLSNPGRPRVFVVTAQDLPEDMRVVMPDNIVAIRSGRTLTYELRTDANAVIEDASVTLLDESPGLQRQFDPKAPEPLTVESLIWWYQLIYGDARGPNDDPSDPSVAMRLLSHFFVAGGALILDDPFPQNLKVRNPADDPNDPDAPDFYIRIDEDCDPVEAAAYLYTGLRQAMAYNEVRYKIQDLEVGDRFPDTQAFALSYLAAGQRAAQITANYANAYLCGVSVSVDAVGDITFTISDLADGKFASAGLSAAATVIPFVPATVLRQGRRLHVESRLPGTVDGVRLFSAGSEANEALRRALDEQTTLLGKYNEVAPHFGLGERLRLVDAGLFGPVPKERLDTSKLRDLMAAAGKHPPTGMIKPIIHHDLPWEYRRWFLAHGIDVDSPEFLRYVDAHQHANLLHDKRPPFDHASIRQQMQDTFGIDETSYGGAWNAEWLVYMSRELQVAGPSGYTRDEVIQKMRDLRDAYELD